MASKEGVSQDTRKASFKANITGLNEQFASWVQDQAKNHAAELWTDGIQDYLHHVEDLLKEFSDLIDAERQAKRRQVTPESTPAASPAFSFGAAATPLSAPGTSPALFKNMPKTCGPDTAAADGKEGGGGKKRRALDTADGGDTAAASPSAGFLFGQPTPSAPAVGATREADPAPKPFNFGASIAPSSDAGAEKNGDAAPKSMFTFGGEAAKDTGADANAGSGALKPFSFGAAAPSASAAGSDTSAATTSAPKPFGFGAAATTSMDGKTDGVSAGGGFSFGSGASAPASSGGFNFGSTAAPFSFGGTSAVPPSVSNAGGEGAEEDEAPAKFESEVAVNEEAGTVVFKAKSKFLHFVKDGAGAWEGKGVGTLMLRQRADDPKKAIITFTTEAGRVLYITNLPKSMSVILSDAKPTASFSAPWSPDGQSTPTLQMVMFMLPKGKNVEFKAEIEKLQAAMP